MDAADSTASISPEPPDEMNRPPRLPEPKPLMRPDAPLVAQLSVARELGESFLQSPCSHSIHKRPANALPAAARNNIPSLQIRHGSGRSPLNVIIADRNLRESDGLVMGVRRQKNDAFPMQSLLNLQLVALQRTLRPQSLAHGDPGWKIGIGHRPDRDWNLHARLLNHARMEGPWPVLAQAIPRLSAAHTWRAAFKTMGDPVAPKGCPAAGAQRS